MALDPRLWAMIRQYSPGLGLDPRAAASVAMNESGGHFGAVGDSNSSYGPWQLHVGGALPRGRGAAWANSRAGVLYALRQMAAAGARGLHGQAAVSAIARNFERPADPGAEIQTALRYYRSPGFARGATAAGMGGGGAARGGGGAARGGGGGGGAVAALLAAQQPIQVSPALRQTPTALDTLQNLYAPQPQAQQQAFAPEFPVASTPGPTELSDQLNSLHNRLLGA